MSTTSGKVLQQHRLRWLWICGQRCALPTYPQRPPTEGNQVDQREIADQGSVWHSSARFIRICSAIHSVPRTSGVKLSTYRWLAAWISDRKSHDTLGEMARELRNVLSQS